MFKNIYFRLGIISAIFTISLLIALPQVPIKIHYKSINLDTSIGGYYINLFNNKFVLNLKEFKKGLDLKGGIRVEMQANMEKIPVAQRDGALESAKDIISRRVNMLGVTEPNVSTVKSGDIYRIIVEIPGLENVDEAVKLIGQTAQLRFKTLKADKEWKEDKFFEYYQDPTAWEDSPVTGSDLKGADVVVGSQTDIKSRGTPQIQLKFTDEGRKKFSDVAKANVGKPVGLFLDDSPFPLSAPVINPDLAQGVFNDPVISGNFTFDSAKNLSIQIRAGALPVPVKVLQQETIGATLGGDSIHKSFFAGFVGLFIVFIFLVFKYRRLGLIAGVSLILYSVIVLAIFKLIPVVLTLPGIAGFILSIGMATDANILIFERIKEEIYWGKPYDFAIRLGFERAWNSIKDSNISSLITSFILFQLGTGPVKGFALTLAVGIVVSLFSSIFVVRTLIEAFKIGGTKQ